MPDSPKAQFTALVLPHLRVLYRVAYRLVRNSADAQDLVQDTCVAACQSLPELSSADSSLRWLLRVQHNRFIDGARRKRSSPVIAAEAEEPDASSGPPMNPELLLQQSQDEQLLQRAFLKLDEMQRTLLGLRIEGYGLPEIEAITGVDRKVLSKRLHRARQSLARHLIEQTQMPSSARRTGSNP